MSKVQDENLKNWAGNLTYSTSNIYYPQSVEEVQELVKKCKKVRVLGTRHCFNTIADSHHHLISTSKMNKVVVLDADAQTVTVEGGIKYGELCPLLHQHGFALHNMASLPHISVAGSCATATHGSGVQNGNLSTAVKAMEVVTAEGSIVHFSQDKNKEELQAAVVNLGALGLITKMTLAIEPTYEMQQHVYVHLPLSQLKAHFETIVSAGYSVSLFTDWQRESINEVWIKSRIDSGMDYNNVKAFYDANAATKKLHPIADMDAENCTEQLGIPGPWYERLPHFRMGFTPSSGKELQSEYFVPFQHAVEAIMAVARLGKEISPYLFISEIRTVAADSLWLSLCRNQASVALHFTWKQNWPAVRKLLPVIEKELEPFHAKPHWGKLFRLSPQKLTMQYEKLEEFKKMTRIYDPQGKFHNDFLNHYIFNKM